MPPDGWEVRWDGSTNDRLLKAFVLLVSRRSLSAEQAAWARNVLGSISDHEALASLADASFASPFLARHSRAIGLEDAAPDVAELAVATSKFIAARNLMLAAEQDDFHTSCVVPLTDRYFYFKGPVLAAAQYGDIGLRPSRDIDILVHPDDFEALLRRAWSQGFLPMLSPGEKQTITSEQDFRSLLRFSTNHVVLLSKRGMMIEVHVEADTLATIPGDALLKNRVEVNIGARRYWSLSLPCLFTYLCHHHSRHFFSRAQWIADLEVLRAQPDFSISETLDFARRHELEKLVEACLEFADLTGDPARWIDRDPPGEAGELLTCCLAVLGRPGTEERQLTRSRNRRNLIFSWERSTAGYRQVLQRIMQRRVSLRGERYMFLKYYVRRPLPLWLHWLYVFPRIRDGLTNRRRG